MHKIILGTVQFGMKYGINNTSNEISFSDSKQILDFAYKNGIKCLDTAEAYGDSMNKIGDFHKTRARQFKVINKYCNDGKQIEDKLKEGLKTTNLNFFEGYLIHNVDDLYNEEIRNELSKQKKNGRLKKIGVSIYTNDQFLSAISFPEIDIIQLPFNLLDNYTDKSALLKMAKLAGKELHVRSIFLQGLFFKDIQKIEENLSQLKPYITKIKQLSIKYNTTLLEMCLLYPLSISEIDYVLIGVDNLEHLKMNVTALEKKLDKELIKEINSIVVEDKRLLNPTNW